MPDSRMLGGKGMENEEVCWLGGAGSERETLSPPVQSVATIPSPALSLLLGLPDHCHGYG